MNYLITESSQAKFASLWAGERAQVETKEAILRKVCEEEAELLPCKRVTWKSTGIIVDL